MPRHRRTVVLRNLLRRRLREIGRQELLPLLEGAGRNVDLLVRARPEAYGASYQELRMELLRYVEGLCSGR